MKLMKKLPGILLAFVLALGNICSSDAVACFAQSAKGNGAKLESRITEPETASVQGNNKDRVPGQEKKGDDEGKGNNGNGKGNNGNGKGNNGNGKGNNGNGNTGNNRDHVPGQEKKQKKSENHMVSFDVVAGFEDADVELPEAASYADGYLVSDIDIPYLKNYIFAGWYYDKEKTTLVSSTDTVNEDITLYADLLQRIPQAVEETSAYSAARPGIGEEAFYTFKIEGYEEDCIESFINATTDEDVIYDVLEDGTVVPVLEGGYTYTVTLKATSPAVFVIDGEVKPASMRIFNIVTDAEQVYNFKLNSKLNYIEIDEIYDLTGELLDGLFVLNSDNAASEENFCEGSFRYNGTLKIGDVVAIYDGLRPDLRTLETLGTEEDGSVAYVEIIGKNGNKYIFTSAETTDVLFLPDILPVPANADKDGSADNNSITVDASVMDYSDSIYAQGKLDASTTPDVGDFIAFYAGDFEKPDEVSYAEINSVTYIDGMYTIAYDEVTGDDILNSMNSYTSKAMEFDLDEETLQELEAKLEQQAVDSGFLDEAIQYLTALALETDGFTELSEDLDMDLSSYHFEIVEGTELSEEAKMQLMAEDSKIKIKEKKVKTNLTPMVSLQHFEKRPGIRFQLDAKFKVIIGDEKQNHIEIDMDAVFEQEVLILLGMNSRIIWDDGWWIFDTIDDVEVNITFEQGTYTCVGLTATCKTSEGDSDFDWSALEDDDDISEDVVDIGKQLQKMMDKGRTFLGMKVTDKDGEEIDQLTNGGGLAEKYARFLEDADDNWIYIINEKIMGTQGCIDPAHIVAYKIRLGFIVKANLRITIGASMEVAQSEQYIAKIRVLSSQCDTKTIPIEDMHVNFDFYVFGTAGIQIGLQLELAVGLFSTDLDSVGIMAEGGFEVRFWGYFYIHYYKEKKEAEADTNLAGAILLELGPFVNVWFKAQLFSDNDLTKEIPIYSNFWLVRSIGDELNVNDFAIPEDSEKLNVNMVNTSQFTLPDDFFKMHYLNLREGEEGEDIFDTDCGYYDFRLTDSEHFSFDKNSKRIVTNLKKGDEETDCELVITWLGGPLEFTSAPISRTVKIHWEWPLSDCFISFETYGGSEIPTIRAKEGEPITKPADPVRPGYLFAGWYKDYYYNSTYNFPKTMPDFGNNGGIKIYAKWVDPESYPYIAKCYFYDPATGTDIVEGMLAYALSSRVNLDPELAPKFDGYYCYDVSSKNTTLRSSGTSTIRYYYKPIEYTISFVTKYPDGKEVASTVPTFYGASVPVNFSVRDGYYISDYDGLDEDTNEVTVAGDATYYAIAERKINKYLISWDITALNGAKLVAPLGKDSYTCMNGPEAEGTAIVAPDIEFEDDGSGFDSFLSCWRDENGKAVYSFGTLDSNAVYTPEVTSYLRQYRITYDEGDSYPYSTSVSHGGKADEHMPAGTFGEFEGWYERLEDGTYAEEPFDFSQPITHDTYLKAKYSFDLYVGGERMSTLDSRISLVENFSGGADITLTLSDETITRGTEEGFEAPISSHLGSSCQLIINLTGNTTIISDTDDMESIGIYCDGNFDIVGSGILKIYANVHGNAGDAYGIVLDGGYMTINGTCGVEIYVGDEYDEEGYTEKFRNGDDSVNATGIKLINSGSLELGMGSLAVYVNLSKNGYAVDGDFDIESKYARFEFIAPHALNGNIWNAESFIFNGTALGDMGYWDLMDLLNGTRFCPDGIEILSDIYRQYASDYANGN